MAESNAALSRQIQRQIGSDANMRFLRNLPLFRTYDDMPSTLKDLLRRIDAVEGERSRNHVPSNGRGS